MPQWPKNKYWHIPRPGTDKEREGVIPVLRTLRTGRSSTCSKIIPWGSCLRIKDRVFRRHKPSIRDLWQRGRSEPYWFSLTKRCSTSLRWMTPATSCSLVLVTGIHAPVAPTREHVGFVFFIRWGWQQQLMRIPFSIDMVATCRVNGRGRISDGLILNMSSYAV